MTESGCQQCGENTYSGDGASSCTSCPDGKLSAAGSTSEDDCGHGKYLCVHDLQILNVIDDELHNISFFSSPCHVWTF